jgi:hypothetical protein
MKDAHREAVDAIFDMRRICMDAINEIEHIAMALGTLGLRDAARCLCDATSAIDDAAEKASHAYAESVNQRVIDTERATGNMVSAFIAGIGTKGA